MMPALDSKKSREISLLWRKLGAIKVHGFDTRGTDYEFVRPAESALDATALALIESARACDYLSLSTEVTESDGDSRKSRAKNYRVTERPGVLVESCFDGDARGVVKDRIIPMRDRLANDLGRAPTQRELARALGVSQPTVSQALSRLSVMSKRDSPIRRPVVRVVETGQAISGEVTNVETAAETLKRSDRQLMTVSELAEMLRCSERSIFRRVSDGKIPASVIRRFARRIVLFDRIAVKEWVAGL
jgi:excisionase family DNA binding protein